MEKGSTMQGLGVRNQEGRRRRDEGRGRTLPPCTSAMYSLYFTLMYRVHMLAGKRNVRFWWGLLRVYMSDHSHAQHFPKRCKKCWMFIRMVRLISVLSCVHTEIFSMFFKILRYISVLRVHAHQDSLSFVHTSLLYPYINSIWRDIYRKCRYEEIWWLLNVYYGHLSSFRMCIRPKRQATCIFL